jgi:hypothetical protein
MGRVNHETRIWQWYRRKSIALFLNNNAGFSMPIALGMGCLMMLVSASMINRSDNDREIASSYRQAHRALTTAEAGVARLQAFLDRYPLLATQNLDSWLDTLNKLPSDRKNCGTMDINMAIERASLYQKKEWINLDEDNLSRGKYRAIDYQYQNGMGTLTVAGEVGTGAHRLATNTIAVEIPIGNTEAPPALWARSLNLSEFHQISGDVRAIVCPQISEWDRDGVTGINTINITRSSDGLIGDIIADPFTQIPKIKKPPNNAVYLSAITDSIQLPRPDSVQTPDNNGEYHYVVDNNNSGHSIKLEDTHQIEITVPANKKVNLYLKGNIDLGGSRTINVNPHHPNLRIYGGTNTKNISIKDSASITALIHAPSAAGKSLSSPTIGTGIIGGVWVNSWDSKSNFSKLSISQSGNWQDFGILPEHQPPSINPIVSWQRKN